MHFLWMIATGSFLLGGFWRFLPSRRDAALAASAVFAIVLLLITEGLSAAALFYFQPVLIAWIAAAFLAAGFCLAAVARTKPLARDSLIPTDFLARLCIGFILIVLGIVGITAIVSPPNNWDSMTYHMARVANWVQHRTVADYPTQILRQLYLAPWAEFAVANVQILARSDRLVNLVQFVAMIGNIVGITAVSAKLGAGVRAQAIAGLFTATIPILMLEASGTQTDVVAGFWVVCAINAGLWLIQNPRFDIWIEALLATAVGLAFLTKATTAFILAPFVFWIVIAQFRVLGKITAVRLPALLLAIPLLLNAGHLHRNHATFGRYLAPDSESGWYRNSLHTPGAIVSNLARNILSNTGFKSMHRYPAYASRLVRLISGLNESDPRITYNGERFRILYTRDEHDAGNPVHLLLGAIGIVTAIACSRKNHLAGIYAGCILCGFFLFCFQLKWQPWITRLQLPIFVLLAPLVGLMLDRFKFKSTACIVVALLFAQSFIYLLFGFPRPLMGRRTVFNIPRADQYFTKRPDLRLPYQQAANIIGHSSSPVIALTCKGDSWEYALRSQLPVGTVIEHVGVTNQSRNCPAFIAVAEPAFLVQLENAPIPAEFSRYKMVYRQSEIAVYKR